MPDSPNPSSSAVPPAANVATCTCCRRRVPFAITIAVLGAALVAVYLCSFLIGSVNISVGEVIDILRSKIMPVEQYWTDVLDRIMVNVRFPQITLSVLIGGALSVSGAS